jgi:hypothetical protein
VRPYRNCRGHIYWFHKYLSQIVATRAEATGCATIDRVRKISQRTNDKQQTFHYSARFWGWIMTLTH